MFEDLWFLQQLAQFGLLEQGWLYELTGLSQLAQIFCD